MTLREEVLKDAGVLEEGKFKNFLIASLITAAAITAAVKGIPAGKAAYNQYKHASALPATMKYVKADMAANRNSANWRGGVSVYTDYSVGSHQPILNIDVNMRDYVKKSVEKDEDPRNIAKDIQTIILAQLDSYLESIKSDSSKLEKYLSKGTYIGETKPLKIQLDFKLTDRELKEIEAEHAKSEFDWLSRTVGLDIAGEIARKLGVNREYVDIFVNGQSTAFKR